AVADNSANAKSKETAIYASLLTSITSPIIHATSAQTKKTSPDPATESHGASVTSPSIIHVLSAENGIKYTMSSPIFGIMVTMLSIPRYKISDSATAPVVWRIISPKPWLKITSINMPSGNTHSARLDRKSVVQGKSVEEG